MHCNIKFDHFYQQIAIGPFSTWLHTVPAQLARWQVDNPHGQLITWLKALEQLPFLVPDRLDLQTEIFADDNTLPAWQRTVIYRVLKSLMPWRKGPFSLYGTYIDAEWRSDWKWQRLEPYISPLLGRQILDVGCGNGYYLWRMLGAGAKCVIGIDPATLFFCQFNAIYKLLGRPANIHMLPLGLEALQPIAAFDTVFSMGVLYHRRSPLDHLEQLYRQLVSGGELVLETLVIEGNAEQVLVPTETYARMRNLYFIPSVAALHNWLLKCHFINIRTIALTTTTREEQRHTDWMQYESLAEALDPADYTK